jgi:hypothetical protein
MHPLLSWREFLNQFSPLAGGAVIIQLMIRSNHCVE